MPMLKNPIFKREFSSSAKSLRTNFLVWTYLVLLAGVLLLLWPDSGVLSMVSSKSKQIFSMFFSINLTLLILLVPAFTASAITYEKENETFAALFTTLLTPFDIMFGKLAASITMLVALVFLSMPIASVCALTGGVSLNFMIQVMILIISTAVTYGLIGLACSAMLQRSSSSIVLNYVLILILAGGTWLPEALLSNLLGYPEVWQTIRSISPFDGIFFLLYPENYRMTRTVLSTQLNPYHIFLISCTLFSFISLAIFYYRILRPASRSSGPKGEMFADRRKAIKRKLKWPFYLIDPLKRKKMIGKRANPVFVSEMRSKLFANPKFVLRTVSAIFIISLGILTLIALQFGSTLKADTVRMVAIIFQIGVVAMLAPSVSSSLITEEIIKGTFMQLRMTSLSSLTVILGKLKATFFYACIFIISSLFVLLAMAYLEHQQVFPDASILSGEFWNEIFFKVKDGQWWVDLWNTYRRLVVWVGILLLSTLTFLTGGLFASSVSRTTGVATAMGYTFTAIICLVSFAPLVLGQRLAHSVAFVILACNPIAGAMQITSDAFLQFPGLWKYNLLLLVGLTLFFLAAATIRTWYLFHKQE